METAIELFLKAAIQENDLSFLLNLEIPNRVIAGAIEEGRQMAQDQDIKGFTKLETGDRGVLRPPITLLRPL